MAAGHLRCVSLRREKHDILAQSKNCGTKINIHCYGIEC
jgi:hypothetical protein